MGVMLLYDLLRKFMKEYPASIAPAVVLIAAIPILLLLQNFDDHDRSDRYTARDIAAVRRTSTLTTACTPLQRAKTFEECRLLSVSLGGTFDRSFELSGPHNEPLVPPSAPDVPPQRRGRKRPRADHRNRGGRC